MLSNKIVSVTSQRYHAFLFFTKVICQVEKRKKKNKYANYEHDITCILKSFSFLPSLSLSLC